MKINGIKCIYYRESIIGLTTAHRIPSGKYVIQYEPNGMMQARHISPCISPPLDEFEIPSYADALKLRIINQFNHSKHFAGY